MATLERELKLAPPSDFALDSVATLKHGLTASRPALHRLHTVYYDTPDMRLLRWGCNLRHRASEGWTLKLPDAAQGDALSRRELTFEGDESSVPPKAGDAVLAFTRGKPLMKLVELRTLRSSLTVSLHDEPVAEIDDDHVHIVGGIADGEEFRQVEIELKNDASDDILAWVRKDVCSSAKMRLDPTPKLLRALGLQAQPSPEFAAPKRTKHPTLSDVLRASLAKSAETLFHNDPQIRIGNNAEIIHKSRTAVRRLRSDLQTFKPLLDATWAEAMIERLRWLGDELGCARDAGVLMRRLKTDIAELPNDEAQAARPIAEHYEREEREARERIRHALSDPKYLETLHGIIEAVNAPVFRKFPDVDARDCMPSLMKRAWKKVRNRVRALIGVPTNRELHRIRIAAKRARYAAEMFEPVACGDATKFAKDMRKLQDLLGDHHDAVVTQRELLHYRNDPNLAFVAGKLSAAQAQTAQSARCEWRDCWRHAARKRLRFWA